MMKVDYTLTDEESQALDEILAVENRYLTLTDRRTANDLIVKILKSHLKIHVDKIKARKLKAFAANYDALAVTEKQKVDAILKEKK